MPVGGPRAARAGYGYKDAVRFAISGDAVTSVPIHLRHTQPRREHAMAWLRK